MIRQLGGLPRTREADCFHPEKDSLDWGLDAVFASPKHFLKRTLRISLSTMRLGHFSPMSNESELSVFCPLLALKSWEKNRPHAVGSVTSWPLSNLWPYLSAICKRRSLRVRKCKIVSSDNECLGWMIIPNQAQTIQTFISN